MTRRASDRRRSVSDRQRLGQRPAGYKPLMVGVGEILWDLLPNGRQVGGAPSNVAWHAAQLGLWSVVVSAVGDDDLGRELLVLMDELGIDRSYVAIDPDHPTGTAGVQLDRHGNSTFTITEGVAWDHIALHAGLPHLAVQADAVCVGTLAQRCEASRETIQAFLAATRKDCLRIYDVNLRQHYFNHTILDRTLGCCQVVKLNEQEWPMVAKLLDLPHDLRSGAMAMRRRYDLRLVAVTRGAEGSVLCDAIGLHDHAGIDVQVVDTIGAGDAFTAALGVGLLRHLPLPALHDLAARTAAFVCTKAGATPRLPSELATAFGPVSG
jgi:fructokinase